MSEEILQRLTRLEVITTNQDREFNALRSDIKDIKTNVQNTNLVLAERKGGAKYLMVLLSTSALIGGLLTQAANWKFF
jgi:hypothetical protein